MTPERWSQIEELFYRMADCPLEHRNELLLEACEGDSGLRRELEVLLANKDGASNRLQAAVQGGLDAMTFPLVGKTVSHYRILDGLGGGGMGLVYTAEDIRLGRRVALKFLPEGSAQDTAALRRFEREARSASALEHPNICPIYEFGEHKGQPFLVMQLLQGQTLREMLEKRKSETSKSDSSATPPRRHALSLDQVLDLAVQIASGLDAAHQKSIIHRDIKPANIFVTSQGQAKILDFGLAKLAGGAKEEAEDAKHEPSDGSSNREMLEATPLATPDALLSRTGVAMGTAGYMSPEQARGEKLDARTDLFSFGLVLYEMATGQRAFEGETGPALHDAILTQTPVPARQLNPDLPANIEEIISKALEKNRDARYQTVWDMRADLELLKQGRDAAHPLHWWKLTAGAVAILLITISIFWLAKRLPSSSQTLPGPKLRQLTINSSENPVTGGTISPDGKYLAYTDVKGMHIKLIGSSESQSVPQPEALKNSKVVWDVGFPAWLPSSDRFLANAHPATEDPSAWSSQTTSIWMVSVAGGAPRNVRDGAIAWAVSPDGSSISFGANKGELGEREVWTMDSNGENARKLLDSKEGTAVCCLSWSPVEKRFIYVSTDDSGDTLVSRDVTGGPATTLFPSSEMKKMNDILWLHDGRLIYSLPESEVQNGVCNYWTVRLDLSTGQRIDKTRRLTNWSSFCMSSGAATTDGKRVAFLGWSGFGTVYMADLEAGGARIRNPRHFTLEEADDFVTDWTADSGTVLVGTNRGDHYGLYKQSLKSDTPEPIAPNVAGGVLNNALFSPDGKWVIAAVWPVAAGQTPGHLTIPTQPLVRIPVTGGSPELIFPIRLASLPACPRLPSKLCAVAERSEDHKQMIITSFDPIKGRGSELARFDVDPNLDQNVDNLIFAISPDGTQLAAARSPEDPIEIHSLDGQPTQIIRVKGSGRLRAFRWAPKGNGFLASRSIQDGTELLHVDLQGNTRVLWKSNGSYCFGVPSPDGRYLAIYDWKRTANMWMMENF